MSKMLIGNGVVTTDEVIKQGYDFVGLKMAGMLKVQEPTVEQDLTIKGDEQYYPPGHVFPLAFTTDLPTTAPDVYLNNNETFGPLTVAVKGGVEPYTYQWKRGAANVGSNSPTFGPSTVDSVFPSNGAFNWSCVVTDAEGTTITSNIMPVTAYRLPSFTTQPPATVTVTAGQELSIATTPATTSKAPRTYQWYKDGAAISGATAATYTKASAVTGDAGVYYLIVKDANNKTVQSSNSTVTVNAA
nr:MAG: hypothetical protein [Bacteriophage sp.]